MRKFRFPKGKLSNEGENISFSDNLGNLVNAVKYDTLAPWPYAKGNGLYIRLKSLTADNSKGGNWEAVSLTNLNPLILLQNVGNFTATPQNNTVRLNWTLPNTAFDEILIVAKEASSITAKPDGAVTYTADANFTGAGTAFGGGKVIFKGITGNNVTVSNLSYNKIYYFRAFTKKGSVYTEGVEVIVSVTPICDATGQLLYETWSNIGSGLCTSDIPVNSVPTKSLVQSMANFESTTNQAENFGARYRGYICVPESGNYTFYIASDDGGELWLSTDANPANKRRIAFMPNCSWTTPRNWGTFAEQKSVSIALVAGQKYYVEALYKEGVGGDNLAIGWQTPSNTAINVMPGNILSPFQNETGRLLCETWNNIIAGNCVADIPVNTVPTKTVVQVMPFFETSTNVADNFGTRLRGYINAPQTGNYTFYIASDDGGELWLSTDANPANKRRIAFMPNCSWTTARNWAAFAEQKSVVISLVAGQNYYVEALYKESVGGDNLAIGWQTPSNAAIDVVPGSVLSPFATSTVQNLQNAYIFTSTGHQEGQKAIINWVSNTNKQADYYVVEKLEADKTNFEQLEIVNAQYSNQSNALKYYTITDNAPKKGNVLYRVGVVLEGQAAPQYLEPISLNFSQFVDYAVYPNPVDELVNIDLSNAAHQNTTITLTDLSGKVVKQVSFEKAPINVTMDLTQIKAGQYFIHIDAKNRRKVFKKLAIIR